ncbi:hypothetical protein Cgig2_030982 [Carnegiea gigantea]|uniref:phosphatidylserine decarboxylase n=1 Tax=Carnegiea gigantea TaxID=171969 RepID=A0A9Q1QJ50_9CARY|nr:hypothetical protein Cgig2_030982 [Carnegiea gigantea]
MMKMVCYLSQNSLDLIDAFGNEVATHKGFDNITNTLQKEELFQAADTNGDGVVSMDELAALLVLQQEKEPLINSCPVCGEILDASNMLGSMIHMTLCFNEGTGNSVMSGGFLTEKQASLGWLFKLSEWAHFSSYGVGLNKGSKAAHILVFDRSTKRLVEELISGKIVLSMRAIYQSKLGLHLMDKGAKELLQDISEKQGKKMNSVDSVKDIPKFISFFKAFTTYQECFADRCVWNMDHCLFLDQINLSEMKYPLDHFKTFNEFFIRELKPGARPIASVDRDDVAVCAADCRLTAFRTVRESTRFWVKGRKFSVQGLLGNDVSATPFIDGTLVIFRLAPQDYHRFHFPVSGIIERSVGIPGFLYTVNPIAVNSKYCNVFTENKRVVSIISTAYFGKVAFIAIGATMVGSITFTRNKGDHVKKGDQDAIKIDADLLENSSRSLETLVRVGMQLGVSTKTCNYK